ncbi:MAG TPA: Rpn family recombination-promoting nuclease/putative transposase [Telluria sp.]
MSGDHDTGYKQLFAHPELVRDLLAGFTPFTCFRGLDVGAFERINGSYVSDRFSERHSDMVWRVRIADHVVYVYLLLEFQSQSERWMALRMQVYVGLLYQDLVKRHELAVDATLPPVLPVVFYNGERAWNASGELRELISDAPEGLQDFQASQRYLLIDQRSLDPTELANSRNLVASLFRLELSDSPHVLIDVVATWGAWLSSKEQGALRRSIALWIERLQKREFPGMPIPDIELLLTGGVMGERFQRKYATWAEALEDQGMQKGIVKGREEGRERGELIAVRSTLLRLLEKRFGNVADSLRARVNQASLDEAARWIDRVLDAATAEDVFVEP